MYFKVLLNVKIMFRKIFIHIITISFILFLGFIIYAANARIDFFVFKALKYIPLSDKLGHFGLVGLLTFLVNLSLKHKIIGFFRLNIYLGSIIVFCLFTFEESSQVWINNRTFDLVDLAFNYLGIAIASGLNRLLYKRKQSKLC